MTTGTRRVLAMSLATTLMLALVWLITSNDQAGATETENTCNDVGFTSLTGDTSGPWGSVDFDDTEPTLTLVVEEGFEVRLCVKAGSAQQGDGPEVTGWFDEGTYEVAHSSGKELSHYGIEFRETTTSTTAPTTTSTTRVGPPPPPPPTTTTTPSSSSTTTEPSDTTTTSEPGSTSTAPPPSTTTTQETTTTRAPFAPTTTHRTPSPGDAGTLPFTGIEDWLAPVAGGLALAGLVGLTIAGRLEEE